jgi:hypothetical protein
MARLSALFHISALTLTGVASWGTQSAQTQTFTVVYEFTGEACGYQPEGGLTLDRDGSLYGATTEGRGPGSVFQRKRARMKIGF